MRTRTVTLHKGRHTYIFRYAPGAEGRIVDEIVRLAEDDRTGLDWLDAATLCFGVTYDTANDCYRQMSPQESAEAL